MAALLSCCLESASTIWVFHSDYSFQLDVSNVFICLIYIMWWLDCHVVCLWELYMWVVEQFPGRKHTSEVDPLWFEESLPDGPSSVCSQSCSFASTQTGLWWDGLCPKDQTTVQFELQRVYLVPAAGITCLFSPHYTWLLLLIKCAENTTFLTFFLCRLLSPFSHTWVGCTEKFRPQH